MKRLGHEGRMYLEFLLGADLWPSKAMHAKFKAMLEQSRRMAAGEICRNCQRVISSAGAKCRTCGYRTPKP